MAKKVQIRLLQSLKKMKALRMMMTTRTPKKIATKKTLTTTRMGATMMKTLLQLILKTLETQQLTLH